MKFKLKILPLFFIFSLSQANSQKFPEALKAFESGQFVLAQETFETLITSNPEMVKTRYKMAELALLNNQFAETEYLLKPILKKWPEDSLASRLMAETLYRQDDYEQIPELLAAAGKSSKVRQMEHFRRRKLKPYQIEKNFKMVTIHMETVDLLPSVNMKVNGKEGLFIIDTGGGETILDTEFAKEVQALAFNQTQGVYAGGATAATTFGFVSKLELGSLEIKNVPIHIQSTNRYAPAVGGKQVFGIIGTNLLYHFISTFDYQTGKLVLRKRDSKVKIKKAIQIPFWLASDHLILAQGKINNSDDQLFLVDTGMAGAGFTAPKSTLENANVILLNGEVFEGQGGGGSVSVTPFMIDNISLGELKNVNQIVGLFGAFPPTLETSLGFRIGGLISHSFFRPFKITFDFEQMIIFAEQ